MVQRRLSHLAAEQIVVAQRDAADVLHSAAVVLRDEHLVVLAERVRVAEVLLEHLEPARRDREDRLGVEVLGD
jgi:hypothetical protein